MRRLLSAEFASRRRMVVGLAIGTGLFVAFLASIETFGGLSQFGQRVFGDTPPALAALAGSRAGIDLFTSLGLMAFAYNHPFFLALALAVGLAVGSAAVAGDVESGRAQLLYARPVPRHRLLRGRILFWLVAQVIVVAAAMVGGVIGSAVSADLGTDGMGVAVRAGVQFLPLALSIGALAFATSAFAATRARAIGAAVGLTFLAYLVNFTSLLWTAAEPLRWVTPFGYYDPLAATDAIRWSDVIVLTAVTAVLLVVAHVGLARRDLA